MVIRVAVIPLLALTSGVHAQTGVFTDQIGVSGIQHAGSGRLAVAVADVNLDGNPEIYIARSGGTDFLYENTGAGKFTDVSSSTGISNLAASRDVDFVDYDNDGDLDIYVTNYDQNSVLYKNDNGTFTDIAASAGVTNGVEESRNVVWFDYEGLSQDLLIF